MMDGTAVKEIATLAEQATANILTIEGKEYSTAKLHDPRRPAPEPEALYLNTLSGLVDYIKANRDGLELENCILHIGGPELVSLRSHLHGEFAQRSAYVTAVAADRFESAPGGFRFEFYSSAEVVIIALQALFVDAGQRADALRLLGNLRDDNVKTLADDGVTQTVTARQGIAVAENVEVPNPITLAPYRTFAEIEQPSSPFVLRVRKGQSGVEAALFEADGGAWRLDAVKRIRAWLHDQVPAKLAVIA